MSLRLRRPDGPPRRRWPSQQSDRSGACASSAPASAGLQDQFDRQRRLVELARPVMEHLLARLGSRQSSIGLTDAHGTVLLALGRGAARGGGPTAGKTGRAERAITTADRHAAICWAVCIFDPSGQLLGRLQALVADPGTGHRLSAMVRLSARAVENCWFDEVFRYGLRLHFHRRCELLGSPQEGRVAIGPDGRIVGANSNALALLTRAADALLQQEAADVFGIGLAALTAGDATGIDREVVLELKRNTQPPLFARVRLDWPAPWLQPATTPPSAETQGGKARPSTGLAGSIRTPVASRARRGRAT